jgi:hypothetical protein
MTIIKELLKWKPRADILMKKSKENSDLDNKSKQLENEIFDLYTKFFNPFMSKRIDTDIYLQKPTNENKTNWHNKICLNEKGFSYLYDNYSNNSSYISYFSDLIKIYEYHKEFLPYIQNKEKQKLIKRFFRIFKELKDFEYKLKKEIKPLEIKYVDKDEIYIFNFYSFENSQINFEKNKNSWNDHCINLYKQPVTTDYLLIEKSYPLMIKLLDDYKKHISKMIKQRQKVVDYLKKEFSSELILLNLE